MARLTTTSSTAVVDVPDELVERYKAAGWVEQKPKSEPKKSKKSDDE